MPGTWCRSLSLSVCLSACLMTLNERASAAQEMGLILMQSAIKTAAAAKTLQAPSWAFAMSQSKHCSLTSHTHTDTHAWVTGGMRGVTHVICNGRKFARWARKRAKKTAEKSAAVAGGRAGHSPWLFWLPLMHLLVGQNAVCLDSPRFALPRAAVCTDLTSAAAEHEGRGRLQRQKLKNNTHTALT